MLVEFSLPSRPSQMVRLNEAKVSDVLDFTAIDPRLEEQATTLFLERVQDKEHFSDPKTWTGDDRRFALFQYFISTTRDRTVPLTYECSICGERHTQDIPYKKILDGYTPINGECFREFPHNGHNIVVRPLCGADLEIVERFRYELLLLRDQLEDGNLSKEQMKAIRSDIRMRETQMYLYNTIACIDMPYLDENGTPQSRRPKMQEVISDMSASEFQEVVDKIEESLVEMRHGLLSEYIDGQIVLDIPDVKCDKYPNEPGILLRYPFRFGAVIPKL